LPTESPDPLNIFARPGRRGAGASLARAPQVVSGSTQPERVLSPARRSRGLGGPQGWGKRITDTPSRLLPNISEVETPKPASPQTSTAASRVMGLILADRAGPPECLVLGQGVSCLGTTLNLDQVQSWQTARGTVIAVFRSMATLLISWACTSTVFCLAILRAAARPGPRMDESMASGGEAALAQEPGVVVENVKTASVPAAAALPSPCHAG